VVTAELATRQRLPAQAGYWHIAKLWCNAELGRYLGIADMAGIAAGSAWSRSDPKRTRD
jgi:hypothetical protein